MATEATLRLLAEGVPAWNAWRLSRPDAHPDLEGADLGEQNLKGINLRNARLKRTYLWRSNLEDADLVGVDLSNSTLSRAILSRANLQGANLRFARLLLTDVTDANLSGCLLYGSSVWNLRGIPKEQFNIVITPSTEPTITVDNVELAQFIYLLLNNQKIRHVIDTITSKVVLILGRFTPERKAVLDAIRDELRKRDYLPVLFDFEKPANRDITETVSTLAHMARFVIADITDAKSIPQELMAIVPTLPSVPVQPLLLESQREYGMFEHFRRFPWVLEPFLYLDEDHLLSSLDSCVVGPAEKKAKDQVGR